MNNVIEKVLEDVADDQVNLKSESARKFIAEKIAIALLNEINVRVANKDEA